MEDRAEITPREKNGGHLPSLLLPSLGLQIWGFKLVVNMHQQRVSCCLFFTSEIEGIFQHSVVCHAVGHHPYVMACSFIILCNSVSDDLII